jgi:hypothetical protein
MTVPAPMPVMAMPMVPAMPVAVVPVMAPTHLFGLEAAGFVRAGDGGTRFFIDNRRHLVSGQRLRRQRRSLRGRSKHGCAGGGPEGEFEKMAAFHDISLFMRG